MSHARNVSTALLFSVIAFASSCSSPQPAAPAADQKAAETARTITDEDRVKWYEDCWQDFNDHKWDDFKKCYADNATSRQMGYGKENISGAGAIVESSQDFSKAFADGHGEPQLILVNGSKIASLYLLNGTNSGPLTGPDGKEIPATSKKFGLLFGHYVETDPVGLRVVKEFAAMDGGTLASQLGLSKNPARPVMAKGEAMPKIVIAKNDPMEMKNVENDKAQMEAFNKHDADAVDMYEADDLIFHDMTQPKDLNKKQSREGNVQFWKAFSDAKLSANSMWGAGDYVVTVGTFEGTNDGDFPAMQLKKTGKKVAIPFLEIDRFEGAKLKEGWLIFDTAMFGAQLGLK